MEVGGRRCEYRGHSCRGGLVYVWRSLLVGPVAALIIVFPLSLAATLCSAVFSTAHFRSPVHHSPLSLSFRRRFWPLFTFPPLPRPLINPPCASAFTSQFSRSPISLSLLCLYTHTLRDVALLLLLLLLHHHQKQYTCFLSSSSACLCVFLHSNFTLT